MDWLINALYYVIPFIILLGILVFVHELGHFLVARFCGVKVEEFSIGFGKELWGRTDKKGNPLENCRRTFRRILPFSRRRGRNQLYERGS